jgi:hypothetical protein
VCTRAVSALAHYLEEEGLATVAISLIRPQTENTKPPRALWVPFELGRPFGPPGKAAFQRRVILAALGMLDRDNGPVIIENFPDDDPRWQPDPGWRPPPIPAPPAAGSAEALATQLEAEIPQLRDAHQRWVAQYGRTAVGLCGLSISEFGRYVADWLCGKAPPSPHEAFSGPLMLRFAVDDVKAYYLVEPRAHHSHPQHDPAAGLIGRANHSYPAVNSQRQLKNIRQRD